MVDGTNATEMQRRIPQNMSSGDEGGKIEGRRIERNTRTDNDKDEQVGKGVNRTYLRCCWPQVHQYIHFPSKHLVTSSLNSRKRTSTKTIQAFKASLLLRALHQNMPKMNMRKMSCTVGRRV